MANYAINNYNKEHMARAIGLSLPISLKHSVEVSNFIRGLNVSKAKKLLNEVIEMKSAVPFKRFNKDRGHKKKIGPGRYPIKTAKEILKILESAEANAQFKGLNTSNLVISHICSNKASKSWHYGRMRGRKAKRANVEIVLEEKAKKKKEEKKDSVKKEQTKESSSKNSAGKVKETKKNLPEKKPDLKKTQDIQKKKEEVKAVKNKEDKLTKESKEKKEGKK